MKRFALSFFILCLVFRLFSCSSPAKESAASQADNRTITDAVGREVEIPVQAERFVPLGNTPGMITYPGLVDKVVGVGESEIAHAKNHALRHCDNFLFLKVASVYAFGSADTLTTETIQPIYGIKVDIIVHNGNKVIVPS